MSEQPPVAEKSLSKAFRDYGTAVFARNPELAHEWSAEADRCGLFIPAASSSGFDIRFEVGPDEVMVYWGNGHSHYEPTAGIDTLVEDLFGLLRDMLSADMRVRELRAGAWPYRIYLEYFDGVRWSAEQMTGLIFWNYFAKRSVKIFSNSVLPGRLSKVGHRP